ncbi:hypothetical protein [Haloechinothrix salitolerans]|uniref:Uncharacterized protein n=1 Tax=Haloechinothrix salitolerans TaxID=926830 RepID=A0ABW2BTE3_9PSEU
MDEFRRRFHALGGLYQGFLALSMLLLSSMLWWFVERDWTNAAAQGTLALFIGWRPIQLLMKPKIGSD